MAIRHINEDDLELFALDRLAEADAVPVNEHLLICQECREQLTECDEYLVAIRAALGV